jgi:hypothetical protein
MSTELPGELTLERVSSGGTVGVEDLQHVPSGTYRVAYVAPPQPTGPCRITLRATGVGTVRADNKPAQFAELVELYRTEWLPEVAKDQKLVCTRVEAIEVDLRIVDGTFRNVLRPELKRVRVAAMEPKYVLRIGATRVDFQSGASFEFGAGQEVVLSETVGTVAAVP